VSQLTREAWRAYFRGNPVRAGDLYKAAGEPEKALKMYLKANDLHAAAEMEELLGRISDAVDLLLRVGDPTSAAEVLARHGQFTRAAQIMGEAGNKVQAAVMAQRGNNPLLAAQYYEQSGRFVEAGRITFQAGHTAKALLLFEKALKQMPSMEALTASEQLQLREQFTEIARFFEQGQAFSRAAEVHEQMNNLRQAAQCWEAAKNFDKAMELYQRAGMPEKVRALAEQVESTPDLMKAEALAAKGEVQEAALLFAKAGNKERAASLLESSGNLAGAAELRHEMGDFEVAGNLYFRVQAYLPAAECFQQARLFGLAKQCYLQAGDMAEASRMAFEAGDWEEAVDFAPSVEEKETILQRLQALAPGTSDEVRLGILKARLFLDLGQPRLCLTCLEDLPRTEGRDELWNLYLGARAHHLEGNLEEAAKGYRRVLAQDMAFEDARERLQSLSSAPPPKPSQAARYTRGTLLWQDEYGQWCDGIDTSLQGSVLINVPEATSLPFPALQDPEMLQRLTGLQHPSILGLRDVIRSDPPTLVYEPMEGRPLSDWLKEGYQPSLYGALDKARQILEALEEAHNRRILHNHLSPAAVLMDREGRVRVRGFGRVQDFPALREAARLGALTPYLAPETAFSKTLTAATDLFSAGALMLHLLTGEVPAGLLTKEPRPPEAASEILRGVALPSAVREILLRLLAQDPADRYARAGEALRDLAALELPPGSVIAGRYEILDELGRGGMGQVFRVKDRELDEVVALKTLRRRPDLPEAARVRFLREIKLTRKITHPNVVRVFDLGNWRDLTFLTMEYIPGKTLSQWIREGEGRQANLRRKVEILKGIALGLSEAHKLGIVHRDLKPQNVILTPSGIPKLLDFGIAFVDLGPGVDLTDEGRFVGSPKYVSPEQIQGRTLDSRSDIYCFGLLAYFLLTGQDAFSGDNATLILLKQLKEEPTPPSKVVRLPATLENLVMACLKKAPQERPASLEEVSKVLKEIV
jgi:serine/threonine protein kinase